MVEERKNCADCIHHKCTNSCSYDERGLHKPCDGECTVTGSRSVCYNKKCKNFKKEQYVI